MALDAQMSAPGVDASASRARRWLDPLRLPHLQRYGLAVLSVGVAVGAALLLRYLGFRDAAVPLLLFAGAVSAWFGGRGAAVLAVILSLLCMTYFFVTPLYSFAIAPEEFPYFIVFAAFASLISWFATVRRRVEQDLRRTRDELSVEVEQRSRLNQELAKRSSALEASNKELEAFAYSISHDLRAPLRHMAGFAELLRKNVPATLNGKSDRYIGIILEAANRMGSLIDDLLAFSRISRAEAHYSTVSLEKLVQEAVAEALDDVHERKIAWKISPLPQWQGDRSMLRLVLVNLISNAVKFTRTRSNAEIEIGCSEQKNDQVVLFVRDNGVGFDMKYPINCSGCFSGFTRRKPSRAPASG